MSRWITGVPSVRPLEMWGWARTKKLEGTLCFYTLSLTGLVLFINLWCWFFFSCCCLSLVFIFVVDQIGKLMIYKRILCPSLFRSERTVNFCLGWGFWAIWHDANDLHRGAIKAKLAWHTVNLCTRYCTYCMSKINAFWMAYVSCRLGPYSVNNFFRHCSPSVSNERTVRPWSDWQEKVTKV